MLADLESIKIAEAYYQDVYLKHLPVPHFKMPEIVIEMPVEVKQINPPGVNASNAVLINKIRDRVSHDLSDYLTTSLILIEENPSGIGRINLRAIPELTDVKLGGLNDNLDTRLKTSSQNIAATVFNDKNFSDANAAPIRLTELADALDEMLYKELTTNYKEYFTSSVNSKTAGTITLVNEDSLRNVLDNARQVFLDSATFILKESETTLDIEGSTDKLAQAGRQNYLTKLKITIREQDYEWTIMDREDGVGLEKRTLTVE